MFALLYVSIDELAAQPRNAPPPPVRFALARSHTVKSSLRLPGTVESARLSQVAAAYPGVVLKVPVEEGDLVEQGQVLAELDRRTIELRIDAVRAQRREAEVRLRAANRKLERARELAASGVISRQDLDTALEESEASEARIETLDAELRSYERDLELCTIISPFRGVIAKRRTEIGQWLKVGDPVADLISLDELHVAVYVPESELPKFRIGSVARVGFDAFPGVELKAAITAIIPNADLDTRSFPVRIALPKGDRRFGAGMTAAATLGAAQSRTAVIVPKDAVVVDGERKTVFVIDENNTVTPHSVRVGEGSGDWIEVLGAIRPGDRVVTRGNERLRTGQTVRPEASE